MSPRLRKILRENQIASGENPCDLVFATEAKKPINPDSFYKKRFLPAVKAAQIGKVRLHDLRHSFASIAVAGGDSLYLVGKVLGHRQARTTERYAHVANDPLRAVADRTAGQIAAAMKGKAGAEVVELPRRKV